MRKALILIMLLLLIIGLIPAALAQDDEEDCAEEEALKLGAHFWATDLNGVTLTAVAVGLEDFNPVITVLDADEEIVACNDDSGAADEIAFNLEGAGEAPASDSSAQVELEVEVDERFDFEIIVTSADGTYGEFVLMMYGTSIFPANDDDTFRVVASEEMIANEAPLNVYAVNLGLPRNNLSATVTLKSEEEEFEKTCLDSSSEDFCEGEEEDLSTSSVTLDGSDGPITLSWIDSYIRHDLTETDPTQYDIVIESSGGTYGPYYVIVHTGVGNPAEAE